MYLLLRKRSRCLREVLNIKGKKRKASLFSGITKKLAFFGILALIFLLMVVIVGIYTVVCENSSSGSSNTGTYDYNASGGFPDTVEAYRPLITELCEEYNTQPDKLNLPDYVNAMLALIQVESDGLGNDPMQASECGYNTVYGNTPNAIQSAEYSCKCGVQYARDAFIKFGVESAEDFDRMAAAVQGYNFGIDEWYKWITANNEGKYTVDKAKLFAEMKAKELGWKSYGTPTHGEKFIKAYKNGIATSAGGEVAVNPNVDDPDGIGQKMATWGLQYVGCKYSMDYRWSNCYKNKDISKENSYWDCSSFAWCAMDYAGVPIPADITVASYEGQWCVNQDVIVCNGYDTSVMQVGDLIFYERSATVGQYKNIGHVSIYIGNGKCVHAKGSAYGVVAEDVSGIDTIVFVARPAALVGNEEKESK